MRRVVLLLLLAEVVLCCLGLFFSLPATTASSDVPGVPSGLGGANAGHVDRGTNAPSPLPEGSYPAALLAEEAQEKDKRPVNVYLLTMIVLMIASFGAGFLRLLTTNASRRGAICSFLGVVRASLGTAREEQSFLGVFLL